MQAEMHAWVDSLLALYLRLYAESPSEMATALGPPLFAPGVDPKTQPDAEKLAAVRNLVARVPQGHPYRAEAGVAMLDLCTAIEEDDGGPAALARFHRAQRVVSVWDARQRVRTAAMLTQMLPLRRASAGVGVGAEHPGIAAMLRALVAAEVPVGVDVLSPAADGAPLLAWVRGELEAPRFAVIAPPLAELLVEIEADDGTDAGWSRLMRAVLHYLREAARLQLDHALAALGS